jgi:hypothetical protein
VQELETGRLFTVLGGRVFAMLDPLRQKSIIECQDSATGLAIYVEIGFGYGPDRG